MGFLDGVEFQTYFSQIQTELSKNINETKEYRFKPILVKFKPLHFLFPYFLINCFKPILVKFKPERP